MQYTTELLTVKNVAECLKVSPSQVWKLIASGKIQSVKIARSRRVSVEQLQDFIRQNQTGPPVEAGAEILRDDSITIGATQLGLGEVLEGGGVD